MTWHPNVWRISVELNCNAAVIQQKKKKKCNAAVGVKWRCIALVVRSKGPDWSMCTIGSFLFCKPEEAENKSCSMGHAENLWGGLGSFNHRISKLHECTHKPGPLPSWELEIILQDVKIKCLKSKLSSCNFC